MTHEEFIRLTAQSMAYRIIKFAEREKGFWEDKGLLEADFYEALEMVIHDYVKRYTKRSKGYGSH